MAPKFHPLRPISDNQHAGYFTLGSGVAPRLGSTRLTRAADNSGNAQACSGGRRAHTAKLYGCSQLLHAGITDITATTDTAIIIATTAITCTTDVTAISIVKSNHIARL